MHVRIPPHARFSRTVRKEVAAFARRLNVRGPELDEFIFALGEALANAIEHGKGDAIDVRCNVEDDKILATVTDAGAGFGAHGLATMSLPNEYAERGRGLPIMRRCTDIFAVHSIPGRGTAVVLGRYLPVGQRAWPEESEIAS